MDRYLKVYNNSSLIDTINLNSDLGSAVYDRIDRRIELAKVETENTAYYNELYVPTFNFEFNDSTTAIMTKILNYQILQYDFVISVGYQSYSVVLSADSFEKYHPHYDNFKRTLSFESIMKNYIPGMEELVDYDNIYTDDSVTGLVAGSEMQIKYLVADIGGVLFATEGSGSLLLQLYNASGIAIVESVITIGNTMLLPVDSGINTIKLTGQSSSGVDTIEHIKIYGV